MRELNQGVCSIFGVMISWAIIFLSWASISSFVDMYTLSSMLLWGTFGSAMIEVFSLIKTSPGKHFGALYVCGQTMALKLVLSADRVWDQLVQH